MTANTLVSAYMEKAVRALSEAQLLLVQQSTEGACNRAYYAMFDAAHAALWSVGHLSPGTVIKTHSGLISAFGESIIKNRKIGLEHGRAFSHVFKVRLLADYTTEPPDMDAAKEAVALASSFIVAVEGLISKQPL